MCSVVGYIGQKPCRTHVIEGLLRLEYRGYDSSGFVCLNEHNKLEFHKAAGNLSNLIQMLEKDPIDGRIGVGHTRWSTHGVSTFENAHPLFDCHNKISIVHNGIIENYHELAKKLKSEGHIFKSQTDTETVVHLIESELEKYGDLKTAIIESVKQIQGAFSIILLFKQFPDLIVIIRKRTPLCIGLGEQEMFVASDFLAFTGKTDKVVFIPDETFGFISKDKVELFDFHGNDLNFEISKLDHKWQQNGKDGFEHFMLKEIYEQKKVINDTVHFLSGLGSKVWDSIGLTLEQVKNLESINFVACGTSWNASYIAKFFFEEITKLPVNVHLASEFRYMPIFEAKNTIYFGVSQSGETADTLEAINLINLYNMHTVAVTNIASSAIVRESNGILLTQAGKEVAVASTKAFTAQLAAFYWLANKLALAKELITKEQFIKAENDLKLAGQILEDVIENFKIQIIEKFAPYYSKFKNFIFLGRNISYPFALEAALKLKEITYCHAQCYPAGELKHGPIALIDNDTPIFMFSSLDPIIYQKLLSNAQEVKARKGHLVVIAFEGQNELCELADYAFILPKVTPLLAPLAMTGLMQFFAYQIAKELKRPIDKPRNLAKSVTVE
ncbi:glutamine--fructose-6-phosphate transaminase (isomerizing) [Candidatus Dependentiae bacterium]|nr:glutamine--fructose-6-phosphate transaminase (isomerizing) [Candidatus Dependentiae bacterium]